MPKQFKLSKYILHRTIGWRF